MILQLTLLKPQLTICSGPLISGALKDAGAPAGVVPGPPGWPRYLGGGSLPRPPLPQLPLPRPPALRAARPLPRPLPRLPL